MSVLNWGARITSIKVPLGSAEREVLLGFDSLAGWLADRSHQGATAGRFANRIAGARFTLDGREFRLAANQGPNTLHGGPEGFAYRPWKAEADGEALLLVLVSPDGDQGFPGRLQATVRYAVEGDAVVIRYSAATDAPTVVNLTNHAYFNLAGSGDILGHVLTIAAERYLPVKEGLIPTGERVAVAGTPLDFRTPMVVGERIDADFDQLRMGGGYDQCFVLADAPRPAPLFAARLAAGGIALEVSTTEPAIQAYSGNNLKGEPHQRFGGFCLESQHFPNSPNQPDFPSTVLRPGEVYRSETRWRFGPA
jgi:aldose 1-epimerase